MRIILLSSLLMFGLTACVTQPDSAPSSAPSGNYTLDPTHTSVIFSLSHSGLSNYTGRFNEIEGSLDFRPDRPENSYLFVRIKANSVDTGNAEFDHELSDDRRYFDSETFPDIQFTSQSVTVTGENQGRIDGELTLKGNSKPVSLDVTFNGAGKSFGHKGKTLGFSATGVFNRSDFNMGYLKNFGIGDQITLRIETEFNETQE